jgi:hypothetical protein
VLCASIHRGRIAECVEGRIRTAHRVARRSRGANRPDRSRTGDVHRKWRSAHAGQRGLQHDERGPSCGYGWGGVYETARLWFSHCSWMRLLVSAISQTRKPSRCRPLGEWNVYLDQLIADLLIARTWPVQQSLVASVSWVLSGWSTRICEHVEMAWMIADVVAIACLVRSCRFACLPLVRIDPAAS